MEGTLVEAGRTVSQSCSGGEKGVAKRGKIVDNVSIVALVWPGSALLFPEVIGLHPSALKDRITR